jgi:MoaA/NifB/PqqE/SkfB family radical SAM enzyme
MKEFLPWSKASYKQAIDKYIAGRLSIIDVQVSGKCNYNCVYCDSPDRNIPAVTDYDHLSELIRQDAEAYDWMFVCGLGEPLFSENKKALLRLLSLCRELSIKCTIFTNGSGIDDEILTYVKNGILYPLIKIDTFSFELATELYGTLNAHKTLEAIESLFAIAKNAGGEYAQIAASIVPTSRNLSEIATIVERCMEHSVFPLLGQLEYAGKAIGSYNELLLTKEQLLNIKKDIDCKIGGKYVVPICPSVIAGIHIASSGYVTVDKKSGLSCSWFWLETPNTVDLCAINDITSLRQAESRILEYRKAVLPDLFGIENQIEEHPFGGCGGNIKDLFSDYLKMQSSIV